MAKFGVNVPPGIAAKTPAEVVAAAKKLGPNGGGQVVLKSQVLAGGRGLGTFKSGLKGGVHIVNVDQAEEYAKKMLGQVLVTKQTGAAGKPVNTLLVAEKMSFTNEMYFAVVLDRKTAGEQRVQTRNDHFSDQIIISNSLSLRIYMFVPHH